MTVLCRRYGISRKTGYKLLARYAAEGPAGLLDRSRAPHHQPHGMGKAVERAILELRTAHPRWGPRKLRARLARQAAATRWPAASTIGSLLKHHGLTIPRRRRPHCWPSPQPFPTAAAPNELWTTDFKGWFRTRDGARCNPLTLNDSVSRFLLRCQALPQADELHARPVFEAAFREYGLPRAMRFDNGPPFASVSVAGLSRLAVWWVKLGIRLERIAPGHPEQNGRHERFHLTLKQETALPPQATVRAQQGAFDRFRREYNEERPHEALGQEVPATVYTPSPRPYPERVPDPGYAADQQVRRVRQNGEIKWQGQLLFVSECLAGEPIGLEEIFQDCWLVRFGPVELGWLDGRVPTRQRRSITLKLSPMCPV